MQIPRKFSIFFLVSVLPAVSYGQAVTATLLGNVTDTSGAVMPNASVTVTEVRTGVTRTAQTTGQGIYTVPYLNPGTYRLEIEAPGFKRFARGGIELTVGTPVRVDAVLTPGEVTETIEVTAQSPILKTDRADVSQTFDTETIRELPLANRNYQALAGLLPGVTPPSIDFTQLEDPQGTTFFRANGQGNSANNTMVDGVDNTNPTLGLTVYIPPAESVQEVAVSTSNYSAEYGRAGGAVVNVVTRGGTNQFHGSLFEFHRNTNLRARNFFNVAPQPKPTFIRNEFGASIGGPIKRDRTFFFGSYQGRYLRQSGTQTTSLPVDGWMAGDFSGVPGLNLFDPQSGTADGRNRVPFPENRIPQPRFHSVSSGLLPLIPRPNAGTNFTNNFIVNVPFNYDGNSYDGRVDHNFNDRSKIYFKFNYAKYDVLQRAALGDTIGEGAVADNYTVTGIVNFNYAFSPTFLTEARAGYNRYWTNVNGINIDRPLSQELGIRNPNPDDISSQGLARIQISGMQGIGAPVFYPLRNADNLFTWASNWTKISGRHTFKWGAQIQRLRMDRFQPQGLNLGPRGLFNFNPGTTALNGGPALGPFGTFGNSFAAFLLGAVDRTSRTFMPITPTNRQTQVFTFVQDTIQLTSRLTLEVGLRHELFTTVKPRYAGGASNYDVETNSLIVAGIGDVGMSTNVDLDPNNFAPRIGITYRASPKTVFRTGYGLSYYVGRFGFTGGTLSTQFPVIYNVENGVLNDFVIDGSFDTLPVVDLIDIPSNGIISPAPNQGFFVIPRNNPIPFVHSYNFTVQRELPWGIAVDAGYVGSQGRQLPLNQQLNAALPGTGRDGLPFFARFGRTAGVSLRAPGVNNNYNSLQLNATKRFSHGLSFTAAYTFGKGLDVGSDQAGFTVQTDRRRNYGLANFDRTHMFVASHIWELPFGASKPYLRHGPAAWIAGGWQVNGIFRAVTGNPISITADAGPCNCPGNGNYADVVGAARRIGDVGPGQLWFDTSAFAALGANRFGNAGRNIVRGPGFVNYDFSVFAIREQMKLEFRTEFYNLTNTPRFGNPVGNVNAGNFGQLLSAAGEREVQFALRFIF